MTPSPVEPIRKSVVVNTGVERAFELFIDKFDAIKPREHNLLSVPIAETDHRTRVELKHRHLERHGAAWRGVADGVDGQAGWPLYLSRYVEMVIVEDAL